ncbi:MAG: glutamate racemase [Bacteroidetes bacterium]|nr:MAG: glutamate racemase [Bacteroidota bacterium]
MHHLPVGIFDSGLGGLTIVKAVQQLLPHESLIYVGDTAHLPYGDKSVELIGGYATAITRLLVQKGVKAIVIACNTASAVAYREVQAAAAGLPVFNVVIPAVHQALATTQNQQVAVIGTKTTIRTGIYKRLLQHHRPGLKVVEKATPMLVPMIEEGWLHNQVSQDVIDAYMSDTGFQSIDTLILGCTHYPLIKSQIAKYFVENYEHEVHIIDSSLAVARAVQQGLKAHQLLRHAGEARYQYLLSDLTPNFESAAELFLGKKVCFERCALA